jgi:hypothetical protein
LSDHEQLKRLYADLDARHRALQKNHADLQLFELSVNLLDDDDHGINTTLLYHIGNTHGMPGDKKANIHDPNDPCWKLVCRSYGKLDLPTPRYIPKSC